MAGLGTSLLMFSTPTVLGQSTLGSLAGSGQWRFVTRRFQTFLQNLALTQAQIEDGARKHQGIVNALNKHYWGAASETDNRMLVGSWGKRTSIRPPRDVDVLFFLPVEVYHRFEQRVGNKQSQLLFEVREVLLRSYPNTNLSADGQVVTINFSQSFGVEVVPAFRLTDGKVWICDSNNGGRYKTIDPVAELNTLDFNDLKYEGHVRNLVRMLKAWQRWCNVELKSYQLELLAQNFMATWFAPNRTLYWYDWMVRDFFGYLMNRHNTFEYLPGTAESVWLGGDWFTKAQTAYGRAVKACEYERDNMEVSAGLEWQKIFGYDIPSSV